MNLLTRRHFATVFTAAALLSAGCLTLPPPVAHAAPTPVSRYTVDEQAALDQARATGEPATVAEATTESTTTVANPDGTFTFTTHRVAQRVRRDHTWVPIDTTLAVGADGRIRPAATIGGLSLSGGGDQPLAMMAIEGATISIDFPHTLPAPDLAGDTATYRNVLPGTDLNLRATETGYAHTLIVHTPQAATDPRLQTLTLAITTTGADLHVADDGSTRLTEPPRVQWRAGSPGAGWPWGVLVA